MFSNLNDYDTHLFENSNFYRQSSINSQIGHYSFIATIPIPALLLCVKSKKKLDRIYGLNLKLLKAIDIEAFETIFSTKFSVPYIYEEFNSVSGFMFNQFELTEMAYDVLDRTITIEQEIIRPYFDQVEFFDAFKTDYECRDKYFYRYFYPTNYNISKTHNYFESQVYTKHCFYKSHLFNTDKRRDNVFNLK
jgi:hypothetical protein